MPKTRAIQDAKVTPNAAHGLKTRATSAAKKARAETKRLARRNRYSGQMDQVRWINPSRTSYAITTSNVPCGKPVIRS